MSNSTSVLIDADTFILADTPCDLCGHDVGDDAFFGFFMGFPAVACVSDSPALADSMPINTRP